MDIGFWELCLIALVALIVFGPEQLPDVAQKTGRFIRRMRRVWQSYADNVHQSVNDQSHEK